MSPLRRSPVPVRAVLGSLLLLCLALAAPPSVSPQAAEEAAEDWQPLESFGDSISVDVAEIEVWVTDRQGRPVTGLTADDFVLLEDGERVEITNFSSFDQEATGSWASAPAPGGAGEAPAPEPSGAPEPTGKTEGPAAAQPAGEIEGGEIDPERRLHLAILIDNWNLRPGDRARVFQDLREFLRDRLRPEDRAMVLVHDQALALVQEPTADPDELMAALSRIERAATGSIHLENDLRTTYQAMREAMENAFVLPGDAPDPCEIVWGDLQAHAQNYAATETGHYQRSGAVLASAGEILAGVPGRKALLYVGGALPQTPGGQVFHYLTELCPHKQSEIATWSASYDLTWLYEEVARRANAHRLTLYAIEARAPTVGTDASVGGLTAPVASTGGGGGGRRAARVEITGKTFRPSTAATRAAELEQEAGLFYVANETGGRAILNAADFARDFERLAEELRTYYSLGFAPGHGGDGRMHRIEVRLAQGVGDGYRVRHRQSYRDTPYEQRMAERIRGVAQFGTEANRMDLRVETGEATRTGTGYRVPIRLWVPLDELTLVPSPEGGAEQGRTGRLRVLMAVSDAAGNLGPVRQKLVTVEVGEGPPDAPDDGSGGGREHLIEVDLDLPTPRHVVALGLRDELGGEVSFLRHEVDLARVVGGEGGG